MSDQEQVADSLLNTVRQLTALRRAHPALGNRSDYRVVYAQPGHYPFAYLRQGGDERLVVIVNPAGRTVEVDLPAEALPADSTNPHPIWGLTSGLQRTDSGWKIVMTGVSAGIYQI